MPRLGLRWLAACIALLTGLTQAASAAEILIADAKSQPESLTIAPGGILFVGSASTPFVYKVRPGATLLRSSSTPPPKVPAPSSSACSPTSPPTRSGPAS